MFQYQLCKAFSKTRAELLSDMSGDELSHWQAFYSIYPFPEERADMRAGKIVQAIFAGPQKKLWKLIKCMLNFEQNSAQPEQMSESMIKGIFKATCKGLPVIRMKRPKK